MFNFIKSIFKRKLVIPKTITENAGEVLPFDYNKETKKFTKDLCSVVKRDFIVPIVPK